MKKTCIFIVGSADEAFTLNELPYLARHFERVHVFALNMREGESLKAEMPKGVVVHPVGVTKGKLRILKYCTIGLLYPCKELRFREKSLLRLMTCLYARGRSSLILKHILQIIRMRKIDCTNGVVYSYWFTDQAIVAWRLGRILRQRGGDFCAVSRAHGYDLYWERNPIGFLPYQDLSLRELDGVYPCSEHGVRYLREKYPQFGTCVHVARLGTKDQGVASVPQTQDIFITCGRIASEKRIPLFAKAFCAVVKVFPTAHWYCIGDGEELRHVKAIVRTNGIERNVTFMGRMLNEKVYEFFLNTPISYLVNTSESEGVPVSIMEAMSFGIPILATDVGGSGELVSSEVGMLIKADVSVEELAGVVKYAITLPSSEYLKKRETARKVWERMSSAEKNFNEWCRILEGKSNAR